MTPNFNMGERLCNEINPFTSAEGLERKSAHALRMRGERMFQSVPRGRTVGSGPLLFRWLVGAIFACGFLGFIGFQILRSFSPPMLTLAAPLDGVITDKPEIFVSGHADPEVAVQINGQQVFSGPDGAFSQQVELQNGPNQIVVRAEKSHGLFTTLSRTIMLKMPDSVASPVSLSPGASGSQFPAQSLN